MWQKHGIAVSWRGGNGSLHLQASRTDYVSYAFSACSYRHRFSKHEITGASVSRRRLQFPALMPYSHLAPISFSKPLTTGTLFSPSYHNYNPPLYTLSSLLITYTFENLLYTNIPCTTHTNMPFFTTWGRNRQRLLVTQSGRSTRWRGQRLTTENFDCRCDAASSNIRARSSAVAASKCRVGTPRTWAVSGFAVSASSSDGAASFISASSSGGPAPNESSLREGKRREKT
jgi:hypothetical protein